MNIKYKNENHHLWKGGKYIENGYVMVKADSHPNANERGYVAEHRLVIEKQIGRFLSSDEVVHHINRVRGDNRLENLELKVNNSEHIKEHKTARNLNGQIIASQPIFNEIKFRLYDSDRGVTLIYTLSKLIGTTFRRGKFEFRGRWTGLKDKNGKEIFEGDIVTPTGLFRTDEDGIVNWDKDLCGFVPFCHYDSDCREYYNIKKCEIIGNIYENPELLEHRKVCKEENETT